MFRVLLIDDEEAILSLLRAVLQMEDFAVETANCAADAVSLLAPNRFDLVVTDLRMETPTAGFDVVAAANRLTPRPTIAILTAFPLPNSEWRKAGADALYIKGADTMRLPEQLKLLLKRPAQTCSPDRMFGCCAGK